MLSSTVYAGMDISRDQLDLNLPTSGQALQKTFTHDRRGHAALVRWLTAFPGVQVICEATGGFERPVVDALQTAPGASGSDLIIKD
jgi:transposase